ncbi:DNA primase [Candidatus Uhrbacteria bacterium]|nr:DNA primase [Candidatus Uhrbacteria bacterium]
MLDPKDEIKQKIDIVELIGEYLTLKPAGTHAFKAVCPFHAEKTPSLHVSSDRQIWHCFGCGEGGDCLSFVMKMEGMDFAEALMHLGQKVGVEVKRFATPQGNQNLRLSEINELAARYYQKVLEQSSGAQEARAYVQKRGITSELSTRFGLGYAMDQWDGLCIFLLKRGYAQQEIVAAGLGQTKRSGSGLIDRFRGRLMIPLRDQHGKTVGFTGRLIASAVGPDASASPKYLNSPETPIYHKGRLLYGLDLAKRASKEAKAIIIVEGNLDVVASHKAGVEHVVASSGTALTRDQFELLSRYTQTVIFCFDQDAAGLTAAKRGVSIAHALQFDIRAILLPDGAKDPDDLVQKDPMAWRHLCETSIPFMAYLVSRTIKGKNLTSIDDKREISKELLPAIAEMSDPVEQEHWLGEVSRLLSTDESALRRAIRPSPIEKKSAPLSPIHTGRLNKEGQAFALLFGLALSDEDHARTFFENPPSLPRETSGLSELYTKAEILYHSGSNAPHHTFFSRLRSALEAQQRDDLIGSLDTIALLAETTFEAMESKEVPQFIETLRDVLARHFSRERRRALAEHIRDAERSGDQEAVRRLLEELNFEKDP